MEYILCQHVTGGIGGVVHILATKLGSPLSCITPAQYDAKGVEKWRRFILDGLLRGRMGICSHTSGLSVDTLPGSCICSEPG